MMYDRELQCTASAVGLTVFKHDIALFKRAIDYLKSLSKVLGVQGSFIST